MAERLSGQAGLLSSDYDDTIFLTSEPSPDGTDVDLGYGNGLEETFGAWAREKYIEEGGHRGRYPSEIVHDIKPDLGPIALKEATSRVVHFKLATLEECIGKPLPDGTPWPRVTDGFKELWQLLDEARRQGQPLATAVISNGHTEFEQKTFEMAGLRQPDIYVTYEVLEAMALPLLPRALAKPNSFMLDLGRTAWRRMQEAHYPFTLAHPTYEMYAGDNADKDGGLARNASMEFVQIQSTNSRAGWQRVATAFGLGFLPHGVGEQGDA